MIYDDSLRVQFYAKSEHEGKIIQNEIKIHTIYGNITMDYIGSLTNLKVSDNEIKEILESMYFTENFFDDDIQKLGSIAFIPEMILWDNFYKKTFCIVSPSYWPGLYITHDYIMSYERQYSRLCYHYKKDVNSSINFKNLFCQIMLKTSASRYEQISSINTWYVYNRFDSLVNLWENYNAFKF